MFYPFGGCYYDKMMKNKESDESIPNTCLEVKKGSNKFLLEQLKKMKKHMENDGSAMSKLIQMQRWNLPFFRWPLGQHMLGPHVAGVPASAAQEWDPWGARASGAPGDFTNWGYQLGIYWDMEDPKLWSSFLHIFATILKLGLYERLEWPERTAARTW